MSEEIGSDDGRRRQIGGDLDNLDGLHLSRQAEQVNGALSSRGGQGPATGDRGDAGERFGIGVQHRVQMADHQARRLGVEAAVEHAGAAEIAEGDVSLEIFYTARTCGYCLQS